MRPLLIAVVAVAAVLLASVQVASMAMYGDLAHPPAVPALLPPALGIALGRAFTAPPAPAFVRAAYARALLHRGEPAAAAIVAGLPDGPAAAELHGQLAEAQDDPAAALRWYARARDFERAQRLIDAYDNTAHRLQAIGLETELARALSGDADAGVRARALWRLGQLTAAQGFADAPQRSVLGRRALTLYERALEIAPNDETYLLAAGEQALELGDTAAAAAFYRRALDAVPNSADARAGLDRAHS
jgi:tetratricopeptide (TPR) repeat protein